MITSDTFLTELNPEHKKAINRLRSIVTSADKKIVEQAGKIMSSEKAIVYQQEAIFKYGFAKTSPHFTFHSMVMYANTEIAEYVKKHGENLNVQQGCFNFSDPGKVSVSFFSELMNRSAEIDFNPVIEHYKKRKQ